MMQILLEKVPFQGTYMTLVKIFVGSLKILEDLHEDPRADL